MSASESRSVTVVNEQGLHMRPAYLLAETAAKFQCEIEIVKDDLRIDGKSVLSILTLGAAKGTRLELNATGPDAVEAIDTLTRLMEAGFPEEHGTPEPTDRT
jgi:phosphotransferase system HPr (HPr) family protein